MRKWWRKHVRDRKEGESSDVQSLIDGISTLYEARPRLLAELRRARRHERPLTLLSLTPEGKSDGKTGGQDRSDADARRNGHPGESNGAGHTRGHRASNGRPPGTRTRRRTHRDGHGDGHEKGRENANGNGASDWAPDNGATDSSSGGVLHFDLLFVGILLRKMLREADLVALSLEEPGYAVLLPETRESEGRATAARLNRIIRDRTSLTIRIGAAAFPQDGFTIEDLLGRARDGERCRVPVPVAARGDPHPGLPLDPARSMSRVSTPAASRGANHD